MALTRYADPDLCCYPHKVRNWGTCPAAHHFALRCARDTRAGSVPSEFTLEIGNNLFLLFRTRYTGHALLS